MNGSPIEQIREKIDIVELISSYIKLEKTGINYRALCPFHSEKKPSFFVSPARQMFKCFGCGASGSAFDFVMQLEGVEFGDALRTLAQKAGVELGSIRPELKTARQRLYEICELSCCFFEKHLEKSSIGQQARDYLLKRRINEESIKKWRLGYAPETWQGLSDFLVSRGYKREEIVKAGLAVESEKTKTPYDRFRGRIMFPVFDLNSQVIGFGGRVIKNQISNMNKFLASESKNQKYEKEDTAKYINIPNTSLYDKSRVLYGLNFAKVDIRKKDSCILTEGYTDVILSHQAGFENTISVSGTALTFPHLRILKRYTLKLFTAFDMDVAGDLATRKGIDLALKEDFEVKIINMPKDKDPADIISQNPRLWDSLIKDAKDIMSFYFTSSFSKFDKDSPEGKKEISKMLLPKIKQIPNKIIQSHWVQKLAHSLRVTEEAIVEELKKITTKALELQNKYSVDSVESSGPSGALSKTEQGKKSRKELLEEKVLSLIFKDFSNLDFIIEDSLDVFSPKIKVILSTFKKENIVDDKKKEKLIKKLEKQDENLKDILSNACLRAEVEQDEEPKKEIQLCLSHLKEMKTRYVLREISEKIEIAEEKGDKNKIDELIQKFNQMAKILTNSQTNSQKK